MKLRPGQARAMLAKAPLPAALLWLALARPLAAQAPAPAAAQPVVPEPAAVEILVKQTLLTFNDANLTCNYAVFYSTLSDQFRSQISVEQLAQAFGEFKSQQIDMGGGIILNRFALSKPAAINVSGALELEGRFDTRPLAINFVLHFLQNASGDWKLAHIKVGLGAPPQAGSGTGQGSRRGR